LDSGLDIVNRMILESVSWKRGAGEC